MKKNEKKMILVLLGIVIVAFVVFLIVKNTNNTNNSNNSGSGSKENTIKEEYVKVLNDGTKLNTSAKLSETKKLGDLEIGNIQFTNKNGISVILADVVNKGATTSPDTEIVLTLLDKNNNVLTKLNGLIDELKPGAKTQLNIGVTADYANAYDFTIVKK